MFSLDLPVAPSIGLGAPAAVASRRVLLVEQHPGARGAIARLLERLGCEVDVATSGEEAVALAGAAADYDAAFVDWDLPGLDGWQTCARLRGLESAFGARLVMLVSSQGRERLGGRLDAPCDTLDGYLVKPVTATMLAEAMQANLWPGAGEAGPAPPRFLPLAGLRVLVAEDNANNQLVAQQLLAGQGAEVELAGDGAEAVAKVAAGLPFDAVLMDLQMPVLDGLAATREIRGPLGRTDLPIIAMTANAMEADRLACLEAGMVDHIGKPVMLARLVEVLLRHTGSAAFATATPPAAGKGPQQPGAVPKRLDRAAAIERLGGSPELYEQVLDMFRETLPDICAELHAHLRAGERADASRIAHSMKGSAGAVGADRLLQLASQAEAALSGPPGPGDQEAVDRLLQEVDAVLASVALG